MTRTRKYLIIILTLLTALLCAVGASTWIITSPTSFSPKWDQGKKNIYLRTNFDFDYSPDGVTMAAIEKDLFVDEKGTTIDITEGGAQARIFSINGEDLPTDNKITVGSTYQLTIRLDNANNYEVVGTFDGENTTEKEITSFADEPILLKYKTVQIGSGTTYYTIEDALNQSTAGTSRSATIVRVQKGQTSFASDTVKEKFNLYNGSSFYTVKQYSKLLIPYGDGDTSASTKEIVKGGSTKVTKNAAYSQLFLTPQTKLTISENGSLIVNAVRASVSARSTGAPTGDQYGLLEVPGGANVTLENNSTYESIGYTVGSLTKGSGKITAKSGANVYESFIMVGWKGGTASNNLKDTIFPMSQYALINIMCNLELQSGSKYNLKTTTAFSSNDQEAFCDVTFISNDSSAFMTLSRGSVVKSVDEKTLQTTFDLQGDVTFHNLNLELTITLFIIPVDYSFSSEGKVIPIPGNFHINLSSGSNAEIPKDISLKLLPGAELTVREGANLTVRGKAYSYGKQNVTFADGVSGFTDGSIVGTYPNDSMLDISPRVSITKNDLNYSASNESYPAKWNIEGKVTVASTATMAAEPSCSTGKNGKIEIEPGATLSGNLIEDNGSGSVDQCCTNALKMSGQLFNGYGNFEAGKSYTYLNDAWRENTSYTVNYHANGDNVTGINEADGVHSVTVGDNILEGATYDWSSTAPIVSRAHYTFGGWYTNEDCSDGSQAPGNILGGQTLNLYAKWEATPYTIKFVMTDDNGDIMADGSYNATIPAGFDVWNILRKDYILSQVQVTPQDAQLVFFGWYNDAEHSTEIAILDESTIGNVTIDGDNTITLYGWIGEPSIFDVQYVYDRPTTFDGTEDKSENYAVGRGEQTFRDVDTSAGALVSEDHINNALVEAENLNAADETKQYYFIGWFDEAGNLVDFGAKINSSMNTTENDPAGGNRLIVLTAKWAKKAHVTIKDDNTQIGFTYDAKYYVPGNNFQFTNAGIGYTTQEEKDHDVTVETYFTGWNGCTSNSDGSYTISVEYNGESKDGKDITITANRAKKAKIILKSSDRASLCNNQYSIEIDNVEYKSRTKFDGDDVVFYLKYDQKATAQGYCVGNAGTVHNSATKEITIDNISDGVSYTYIYSSSSSWGRNYSGAWSGPTTGTW